MRSLSKWVSSLAAVVLLAGASAAADTVTAGKVKTILAEKKSFVLTEAATNKDHTFKLGANVVILPGTVLGRPAALPDPRVLHKVVRAVAAALRGPHAAALDGPHAHLVDLDQAAVQDEEAVGHHALAAVRVRVCARARLTMRTEASATPLSAISSS